MNKLKKQSIAGGVNKVEPQACRELIYRETLFCVSCKKRTLIRNHKDCSEKWEDARELKMPKKVSDVQLLKRVRGIPREGIPHDMAHLSNASLLKHPHGCPGTLCVINIVHNP